MSELTRLVPIEISALGRVAKLGEFYDSRSEKFLHFAIFNSSFENASINPTQNRETSLQYTLVNTFEEKFRILDICAELKVSILGGLIALKGGGKYFKDIKTSAKSAKATLIQSFSNVYEQVSLLENGLQSSINFDILSKIDATHVVVGIQWGGSVFISVEDKNEENQDVQKIHGELSASLNFMKAFIGSVSAGADANQEDLNAINQYSFSIYGDLVPKNEPQTILDALQFMKQSPDLLLNANNGKGKPIKYILWPLAVLRTFWNIQTDITSLVNSTDAVTIQKCVRLFDKMNAVSQRINDVSADVRIYQKYLSLKKIKEMDDLKSQFDIFNIDLTANLSELLIKTRAGQEPISKLQQVLNKAATQHENWQNCYDQVLTRIVREVQFIQALQKQNIAIFDRGTLLNRFLWENSNKDIYILFFNYDENVMSDPGLRMLKILNDKRNSSSTHLLIAAKYEFVGEDQEVAQWNQTNKICIYRKGKLMFDNYPFGNKIEKMLYPGTWSLKKLQKHIEDLEKRVDQNPGIPEGFIYVQLPVQPEPSAMWKGTKWEDVSSKYAGLFFRTVGDSAAAFGETQQDFAPTSRILQYNMAHKSVHERLERDWNISWDMPNGWSDFIFTGDTMHGAYGAVFVRFKSETKTGEVRPKNTAVRIWKRV